MNSFWRKVSYTILQKVMPFVKQVYLAKGGEIWFFPWITACGMDEVRTCGSHASQFGVRVGRMVRIKC